MIWTGLELLARRGYRHYQSHQLGLLCHQASVDRSLCHASLLLTNKKLKLDLRLFFGPQHGIRGEKQDNMVESSDFIDPRTRLPVISLYAKSREPDHDAMSRIDTLLVDLQDIGCRIYTFMYTMANCMRVARQTGRRVVVLDRPNPIGGDRVDGHVLDPRFSSFVGQYAIPTQHGMTLGELAQLFNDHFGIGCELVVIPCNGWKRPEQANRWGRDWVAPSPNIPTLDSARVFPGSVLFEGTNLSEGRGTTKPFEWVGAPFIDPDKLANEMNQKKLGGVWFRPIFFQPTYQKQKDQVCGGVQIHIVDSKRIRPVRVGIELLYSIRKLYGEKLEWKQPPYEYEYNRPPIDLIAGTDRLRKAVDAQAGLKNHYAEADEALAKFKVIRRRYLLY